MAPFVNYITMVNHILPIPLIITKLSAVLFVTFKIIVDHLLYIHLIVVKLLSVPFVAGPDEFHFNCRDYTILKNASSVYDNWKYMWCIFYLRLLSFLSAFSLRSVPFVSVVNRHTIYQKLHKTGFYV